MSNLKAMAIDDSEMRLLMIESLSTDFNLIFESFTNPLKALERAENSEPDIIFVDYMMPEMNGIEFVSKLRVGNLKIPIIMLTSSHDDDLKIHALKAGVTDFLSIPFNVAEFSARVTNLLEMRRLQKKLEYRSKSLEEEVLKATGKILERERETLLVLAKAAEYKDVDTELHTERVARYSQLLARALGLGEKQQDIIYFSAQLHDIGKIGIPDNILLKNGPFAEDEFDIMMKHTIIGFDILRNSKSEYLVIGRNIALYHHERFDGTGYPHGISGLDIPLEARIVAVADVFDALTTKRPYKAAWNFDDALKYLLEQKEKQFDPNVVKAFINFKSEVLNIYAGKSVLLTECAAVKKNIVS